MHDTATRSKNNLSRLCGMAAIKSKNTRQQIIIKRIASPGDDAGNNKYKFPGKRLTKK